MLLLVYWANEAENFHLLIALITGQWGLRCNVVLYIITFSKCLYFFVVGFRSIGAYRILFL